MVECGNGIQAMLFDSGGPWALIPNIAIHLNREVNKGVEVNAQNEMRAILSVSCREAEAEGFLRHLVAESLKTDPSSIGEYDLFSLSDRKGTDFWEFDGHVCEWEN